MTVVFSPHTDDAIFSLGDYLSNLDGDILIVTPFAAVPEDEAGEQKHTTLHAEHAAACAIIGAQHVNGPFLDDVYPAPAAGRRPRMDGRLPRV